MLRLGGASPQNDGEMNHDDKLLVIDGTLGELEGMSTVLHEVTHAVCPWLTEDHVLALERAQMGAVKAYLELRERTRRGK